MERDLPIESKIVRKLAGEGMFAKSESLAEPVSREELQRDRAFGSAKYWRQVAEATAFFAARMRSARIPLHLLKSEAEEKYGQKIAAKAEELIREAE